jgi:hypothetical protein
VTSPLRGSCTSGIEFERGAMWSAPAVTTSRFCSMSRRSTRSPRRRSVPLASRFSWYIHLIHSL